MLRILKGKKPKANSKFKDYLRKLFINYMLSIVALIFFVLILVFVFYYNRNIVSLNETYNHKIANSLQIEYLNFRRHLNALSKDPDLIRAITGENKHEAYTKLYELANKPVLRSKFIVYNQKHQIIMSNIYMQEISDIIVGDALLTDIERQNNIKMWQSPTSIYENTNKINYKLVKNYPYIMATTLKNQDHNLIGYLVLIIDISETLPYIDPQKVNLLTITDNFDNVIFTTDDRVLDSIGKIKYNPNDKIIDNNGMTSHMVVSKAGKGFKVITMKSVDGYKRLIYFGLLASILLIIIILAIIQRASSKVSRQNAQAIDSLMTAFKEVKNGNLDYQINEDTFEEFNLLNDEFNTMNQEMKALIQKNNLISEHKRIMELKQLESQFNPHFVYNVMEMIRYEILFDPQIASDLLVKFSNLMRYNTNYGNVEIQLATDLNYIESYLSLQKMRFQERLDFTIEVEDEKLLAARIPKLILQPVVENAIKFAIEKTTNLAIKIKIAGVGKDLFLTVEDNGLGIEPQKLVTIKAILATVNEQNTHIGLYNTNRIIKLLYGDAYGVEITSEVGVGTTIVLHLPLVGI